jgi:hypothetical protein
MRPGKHNAAPVLPMLPQAPALTHLTAGGLFLFLLLPLLLSVSRPGSCHLRSGARGAWVISGQHVELLQDLPRLPQPILQVGSSKGHQQCMLAVNIRMPGPLSW